MSIPLPEARRGPDSAGPGEAPVYRELADVAHAAGHVDVSPAQVHKWRMDGLLPPTGEQVSVGRRGFATVRASRVEEQLLALCDFRSETNPWNLLAILLWVDSWPIAIERLRAAESRLASPGPKGEARPTLRPDAQRAPGPERPTTGRFRMTSATVA